MPSISIIIPVYNAAPYLEECLLSISRQAFVDFEILAINDGSTDASLAILEQYQQREGRLRIFSQENSGVSAARNLGLDNAEGDYITFVDADDFLMHHNRLFNLYQNALDSGADIVGAGFTTYSPAQKTSGVGVPFPLKVYSKNEIVELILPYFFHQDTFNSIFTKLYSRSFLEKHQILFPLELVIAEDTYFNIRAFSCAECVSLIDELGYAYREVEGSATKNVLKNDYLDSAIKVYQFDHNRLTHHQVNEVKTQEFKREKFIRSVISLMYIYIHPENQLEFLSKWKKVKEIINNNIVQDVFKINSNIEFNRFDSAIYQAIKKKRIIRLFLYNYYSFLRNNIK